MPRRSILSVSERESLLAVPEAQEEMIRHYTLNDTDLSLIRQRRGDANRLGFAVQLCLLRYPGQVLAVDAFPAALLLQWLGGHLGIAPVCWQEYTVREETRREHLLELRAYLGLTSFSVAHFRQTVHALSELAWQTEKGIVLASHTIDLLRQQRIIVPALNVVERICAEAITRANRRIYRTLTGSLSDQHRLLLDQLLQRKPETKITWLAWLRQSPAKANSRQMLEHIERLKTLQVLNLPEGNRAEFASKPSPEDRP